MIQSIIERIFKPKNIVDYHFECKSFNLHFHLEPRQYRLDCENIHNLINDSKLKEANENLTKAYQRWGYLNPGLATIESLIRIKCCVKKVSLS